MDVTYSTGAGIHATRLFMLSRRSGSPAMCDDPNERTTSAGVVDGREEDLRWLAAGPQLFSSPTYEGDRSFLCLIDVTPWALSPVTILSVRPKKSTAHLVFIFSHLFFAPFLMWHHRTRVKLARRDQRTRVGKRSGGRFPNMRRGVIRM